MTTIVYRDGVLAGDTRGTVGGLVQPGRETKVFRLEDGRAAAITGNTAEAMRLLAWVGGKRGETQPGGECRVIVCGREVEVFEEGYWYVETAPFMAWGSGMPVALGALHAGASAEDAVRIAALVDPQTGGDVVCMKIETKAEKIDA